ncbi:MAG: biotin transporter BioY [Acidobacteriota bacterium]
MTETSRKLLRPLVAALVLAVLTALVARVELPVPGSPVPVSLQSLVVVLAGLVLGWRWGAISMMIYVALGALGLPVYADGASGLDSLLGATGGYLFGFVPAAAAAGGVAERITSSSSLGRRLSGLTAAGLLAHVVIFGLGVPWLKIATEMSWSDALRHGCLPFLPGGVLKSVVAAGLALSIHHFSSFNPGRDHHENDTT